MSLFDRLFGLPSNTKRWGLPTHNVRDYHDFAERMSDVMRLVHLAYRRDSVDVEEWRGRILRMRRSAYEQELTIQAELVGCGGQAGRLGEGDILSEMNERSRDDAESIVNTFNYHLAAAIVNIRSEIPTANRHVYASRLQEWEQEYWGWKKPQIQQNSDIEARSQAQQDFYRFNGNLFGGGKLEPTKAECPVCKGWVRRGIVPQQVALNNPPPYHPNCPHVWDLRPEQVPPESCPTLWMGGASPRTRPAF